MVRLRVEYTADNTVLWAHDAIQSLNIVARIHLLIPTSSDGFTRLLVQQ